VIRAIFMITFLADRSIRPTADDFYTTAVAFSAGGDDARPALDADDAAKGAENE
jgi:hypothetical protein